MPLSGPVIDLSLEQSRDVGAPVTDLNGALTGAKVYEFCSYYYAAIPQTDGSILISRVNGEGWTPTIRIPGTWTSWEGPVIDPEGVVYIRNADTNDVFVNGTDAFATTPFPTQPLVTNVKFLWGHYRKYALADPTGLGAPDKLNKQNMVYCAVNGSPSDDGLFILRNSVKTKVGIDSQPDGVTLTDIRDIQYFQGSIWLWNYAAPYNVYVYAIDLDIGYDGLFKVKTRLSADPRSPLADSLLYMTNDRNRLYSYRYIPGADIYTVDVQYAVDGVQLTPPATGTRYKNAVSTNEGHVYDIIYGQSADNLPLVGRFYSSYFSYYTGGLPMNTGDSIKKTVLDYTNGGDIFYVLYDVSGGGQRIYNMAASVENIWHDLSALSGAPPTSINDIAYADDGILVAASDGIYKFVAGVDPGSGVWSNVLPGVVVQTLDLFERKVFATNGTNVYRFYIISGDNLTDVLANSANTSTEFITTLSNANDPTTADTTNSNLDSVTGGGAAPAISRNGYNRFYSTLRSIGVKKSGISVLELKKIMETAIAGKERGYFVPTPVNFAYPTLFTRPKAGNPDMIKLFSMRKRQYKGDIILEVRRAEIATADYSKESALTAIRAVPAVGVYDGSTFTLDGDEYGMFAKPTFDAISGFEYQIRDVAEDNVFPLAVASFPTAGGDFGQLFYNGTPIFTVAAVTALKKGSAIPVDQTLTIAEGTPLQILTKKVIIFNKNRRIYKFKLVKVPTAGAPINGYICSWSASGTPPETLTPLA